MSLKAFLRGAASILDIGGALGPVSPYEGMTPEQKAKADADALRSDWQAVGDALRDAMAEFEATLTPEERRRAILATAGRIGRLAVAIRRTRDSGRILELSIELRRNAEQLRRLAR